MSTNNSNKKPQPAKEEVPECPECHKNDKVVPVVFGLPTNEAFEQVDRGEIVLGGCMHPGIQTWYCKRDKTTFPKIEDDESFIKDLF